MLLYGVFILKIILIKFSSIYELFIMEKMTTWNSNLKSEK